jgi:hypothetical protein
MPVFSGQKLTARRSLAAIATLNLGLWVTLAGVAELAVTRL